MHNLTGRRATAIDAVDINLTRLAEDLRQRALRLDTFRQSLLVEINDADDATTVVTGNRALANNIGVAVADSQRNQRSLWALGALFVDVAVLTGEDA